MQTTAAKTSTHTNNSVTPGKRNGTSHPSKTPAIQPKLKIGPANDTYEKEADAMADHVLRTTARQPAVPGTASGPAANAGASPDTSVAQRSGPAKIQPVISRLQLQSEEKEEPAQAKPLQLQSEEKEEPAQAKPLQLQSEEKEEPAQAKPLQLQSEEKEEPAQAKPLQLQSGEKEEPAQTRPLQLQSEEKEEPAQAKPLQLQSEEKEEPAQTKPLQLQSEEKEEPAQAKPLQFQAEEKEEPAQAKRLMRKAEGVSVEAGNSIESQLSSSKGSGNPLPDDTRSSMESSFGADFSQVKIHTDTQSVQMNQQLGARAFTHGSDIYFNKGQYDTQSNSGKRLLAHELTHTVQQGASIRKKPLPVSTTAPASIQRLSLTSLLEEAASLVPGYDLIKLILGRSPITDNPVPRTGTNIIRAVVGLIPGGFLLIEKLESTGSLEKAGVWLDGELEKLNITWGGIKMLINQAMKEMRIFKGISGNLEILRRIFSPTWRRITAFASAIKTKILEFIVEGALALAGGASETVMNILKEGRRVFLKILDDPVGFIKNFLTAVKMGFDRFRENFTSHFQSAVFGWLFGAMSNAGIQLPERFDVKGIFHLVAQILGLTYPRIREKIVRKLGSRGETIMSALETTFTLVKDLITKGPIALWEKVQESLTGLRTMIVDKVTTWVTETIVGRAVARILSMLNPAGALVQVAMAIYNTIMFFVNRWDQIRSLVTGIFSSISRVAFGQLDGAAAFIENTMARGLTLLISFLARLIGLGGISEKIRDIIMKIRRPVDNALDKVIDFLVDKGKALFERGRAATNKESNSDEEHEEKVKIGLAAIDTEEAKFDEDRDKKLTQEEAKEVAESVLKRHKVFKSIKVIDGGDSWDYNYVASPGKTKKGSGKKNNKIFKIGNRIPKELLSGKPKNSPSPRKWLRKRGIIKINGNNNWTYTDWQNNTVPYPKGFPDFKAAGMVIKSTEIDMKGNRTTDFTAAKNKVGEKASNSTWHHKEDKKTMEEITRYKHRRFTHRGGVSLIKGTQLPEGKNDD